jgi:hypothetical protein
MIMVIQERIEGLTRHVVRMEERKCRQEYWLEILKIIDQMVKKTEERKYSV